MNHRTARFALRALLWCAMVSGAAGTARAQSHPDDARWWAGFGWPFPGWLDSNVFLLLNGYHGALDVAPLGCEAMVCGQLRVLTEASAGYLGVWDGRRWRDGGGGGVTNWGVFTVEVYDDGSGPAVYAAGAFTRIGGLQEFGLARHRNGQWEPVPGFSAAFPNVAPCISLDVIDGALYVMSGRRDPSAVADRTLARFADGVWTDLGQVSSGYAARIWNVGIERFDSGNGPSIVGLGIGASGQQDTFGLWEWDDASWTLLPGSSIPNPSGPPTKPFDPWSGVRALDALQAIAEPGGAVLYVGFEYPMEIAGESSTLLRWDGAQWRAMGGFADPVSSLSAIDGRLIVAFAPPVQASRPLMAWDGQSWAPVGPATTGTIHRIFSLVEPTGTVLCAAGEIGATESGQSLPMIRALRGGVWAPLDEPRAPGRGLSVEGAEIQVVDRGGGEELCVGHNGLSVWDGDSFEQVPGTSELALSGGKPGFAVFDDGAGPAVYMGAGDRSGGGFIEDYPLWRWDGASVQAIPGLAGTTEYSAGSLAVFDDGSGPALYVAYATQVLMKWNGTTWSSVGSGFGANAWGATKVYTMAVYPGPSGPALYVGGAFGSAGGVPAHGLARWDGAGWTAVFPSPGPVNLSGDPVEVHSLRVLDLGSGPRLYVGGKFDRIGTTTYNNLACWDGVQWTRIGGGVNRLDGIQARIYDIEAFTDADRTWLVAGGEFHRANNTGGGSVTCRSLARWDGARWSSLGSGLLMNTSPSGALLPSVSRLAAYDGSLYITGQFSHAGGWPSSNIARWSGSPFAPPQPLVAGDMPASVAIANFDNDSFSRPDLAVANAGSNDVSILFNTGVPGGAPAFSAQSPAHTFPAGEQPRAVATADIDGDGDADLGVANRLSGSISILLNNGAAVFAAGPTLAAIGEPSDLALADLDGDGLPELIAGRASANALSVFRNIGGGAFGPDQPQNVPPGGRPSGVGSGDLDNDKDVDVVVSLVDHSAVAVFRNASSVGGILLETPLVFPASICDGGAPTDVVLADVDGDGWLDVSTPLRDADAVVVLLNLRVGPGGGWLGFGAPTVYSVGPTPVAIAAGEFYGSGRADLVTANAANTPNGSISLLRNITAEPGLALFQPEVRIETPPDAGFVTAADVNLDDQLDLVLANSVLAGADHGAMLLRPMPTPATSQREGPASSGSVTLLPNTLREPVLAACLGDANGDRAVDLVDINVILEFYAQSGPAVPGDLNADGVVDFLDLNIVLSAFGSAC